MCVLFLYNKPMSMILAAFFSAACSPAPDRLHFSGVLPNSETTKFANVSFIKSAL